MQNEPPCQAGRLVPDTRFSVYAAAALTAEDGAGLYRRAALRADNGGGELRRAAGVPIGAVAAVIAETRVGRKLNAAPRADSAVRDLLIESGLHQTEEQRPKQGGGNREHHAENAEEDPYIRDRGQQRKQDLRCGDNDDIENVRAEHLGLVAARFLAADLDASVMGTSGSCMRM